MSDEERFQAAAERVARRPGTILVPASPGEWFCVIAAVQLAFRHPGYAGHSAAPVVRKLMDQIGQTMSANDEDLRELIERGWEEG